MIKQFTLVILFFFMTGKNRAQLSTASTQVSTFTIEAPQLQDSKKNMGISAQELFLFK